MAAIIKFDQGVLPAGINNRSREDIAAGAAVDITNVSPGSVNTLELLWKPPEDNTAVITGSNPNWQIVPKTGTWGTYRFRLTVDGVVSEHTFDVVSPVFGLPELAPNEKGDPTASLIKNTSTEIDAAETNAAFGIFTSGSAWAWWYKIRRWLRKLDDLFHGTTGHTHDGSAGNGPTITTGTPAHAATTGQTVNDHHNQVHAIGGGDHSGTMTLAQLNAMVSDATLVDKDTPNTWTRKQTFTPTEAEAAIEAQGGASQPGITTVGGDSTTPGNSGGTGIEAQGGAGNAGGGGGAGIETEGGQGGSDGAGGTGGLFGGGDAGGGNRTGGLGVSAAGGSGEGTEDGGIGGRFDGGGANGTGTDGLGLEAAPDVKIKMYSQAAEPTLLEDEAAAFWKNTSDSNRMYLIFRRGAADQVKVEMT